LYFEIIDNGNGKIIADHTNPLCFINLRLDAELSASPESFTADHLLTFAENRWMIKSTKGTPTNMIQGTREIVRIHVLWYKGRPDKAFPNR
jgi:hypothetical protein